MIPRQFQRTENLELLREKCALVICVDMQSLEALQIRVVESMIVLRWGK